MIIMGQHMTGPLVIGAIKPRAVLHANRVTLPQKWCIANGVGYKGQVNIQTMSDHLIITPMVVKKSVTNTTKKAKAIKKKPVGRPPLPSNKKALANLKKHNKKVKLKRVQATISTSF